jgi:hypothetical protein
LVAEILSALEIRKSGCPASMKARKPRARSPQTSANALGLRGLPVAGRWGQCGVRGRQRHYQAGRRQLFDWLEWCRVRLFRRPRTDAKGRLQSFCHAFPGAYHVMGVTLSAGASFRWWRDVAGAGRDYDGSGSTGRGGAGGIRGLTSFPISPEAHAAPRSTRARRIRRPCIYGTPQPTSRANHGRCRLQSRRLSQLVVGWVSSDGDRATGGGARNQPGASSG